MVIIYKYINKQLSGEIKMKKVTIFIIGIIALALIAVGGRYLLAYNGFLDKITNRQPEMKHYSVIVREYSELIGEESLREKSVGLIKTDSRATNAGQKLAETLAVQVDYYDDISLLIEALDSGLSDAMAVENDRLDILEEMGMIRVARNTDGDAVESESGENASNSPQESASSTNSNTTNVATKPVKIIYTFEIELEGDDVEVPDKRITTEPFILYISGSDARNGISEVARSDVNIVTVVNPKKGKILLLSIPRDTYVQLHDTTGLKDKLTHAGLYGLNMSKVTIEDFLNIKIDYTVKVSFDTVIRVVDQLDGIDIFSDTAVTLKTEKGKVCKFIYGEQHIDGDCALRFARERKTYYTGDIHRGQNQQEVLTGIIKRLTGSKDYLLKIPTILDIAADSFETTISRDNVSAFVRMQLTDAIDWKIESIGISGKGILQPTYSMGAKMPLYVMIPDAESISTAQAKIAEYLSVDEPEDIDEEPADNSENNNN